jgi:farnesyl-diphosphate farnesyltransferase
MAECLNWLEIMDPKDRGDICAVLDEIIHGQELDLQRFADPARVVALENAAELEEYTYLVAGCVGKFWSRVCQRHLKSYTSIEEEERCRLGVNFGKGLQLVNILRDLPADLRAGRCYLPLDELGQVGATAETLLTSPRPAREVVGRWLTQAEAWLGDGERYIRAINPFRVRYACILPWRIGVETVARLRQTPALESSVRVKVPRSEVRMIMLKAIAGAFSNAWL